MDKRVIEEELLFYLKKSNKCSISLCFLSSRSRYRSGIFFAAPAPVFLSGSGFKDPQTPGSDRPALDWGKPTKLF